MQVDNEKELIHQKQFIAANIRSRMDAKLFDFGTNERLKMVFDIEMHLAFLGEAIRHNISKLFTEYAIWTNQLLITSGGDSEQFKACLAAIQTEMGLIGRGEWLQTAQNFLMDAMSQLESTILYSDTYLLDSNPHKLLAQRFLDICLQFKYGSAISEIQKAVDEGVSVNEIYLQVITPVMRELGRLWHLNKITVGHEHYCTAVTQMVMASLFPKIFSVEQKKRRLLSICVAGELHEIGARMVSDLFEMNGWDTIFLGADVPVESVINTLIEHEANVLAISVTLVSNLGALTEIIEAVRATPACVNVKILVGGAALNIDSSLWQKLGADGWAIDGPSAIAYAEMWSNLL